MNELDLYGNQITDEGVISIAIDLYGHSSMAHLLLQSILFTDTGALALAHMLKCNTTLKDSKYSIDYLKTWIVFGEKGCALGSLEYHLGINKYSKY